MPNDSIPFLQQFNETNKNINALTTSITKLSVELHHSINTMKRVEEKELVEVKERLDELERKEEQRVIEEARRLGVEETESRQKAFLVNNWHKILLVLGAAAPTIAYVTQALDKAGVLK